MMPSLIIEIGKFPVEFVAADPVFVDTLRERYSGFTTDSPSVSPVRFSVETSPDPFPGEERIQMSRSDGCWQFGRDTFHAQWFPEKGCGSIRQTAGITPIDNVLRVLHTLLLVRRGGFLLHAASAIRNGKAFVFSGVSGAGKTTLSRMAPPDVTLLTDEMSYICPDRDVYRAFGTPFAGDLGVNGVDVSAPLTEINMLAQGPRNKRELLSPATALAALLRNILFLAVDPEYVRLAFEAAYRAVSILPVYRLTFVPTEEVWEMIS